MSWLDSFFQVGGTITLAGDVTGASGANTVAKFSGATVPGSPLSGAGLFLVSGSPTTWTARAISAADVGALAGDVTGLISATVVAGIGTGLSTVPVHCANLTFDANLAPTIGMAQNASGAGFTLSVIGQGAKTGSAAAGGNVVLGGGAGDGAGAAGSIVNKVGAVTLGSINTNGNAEWAFTCDPSRAGISLYTPLAVVNSYLYFASKSTGGGVFVDTTTVYLRDAGSATNIVFNLLSTGASSLELNESTTFTVKQDARSSDLACHDYTVQPQRSFATATLGNRTPGNFVVDVGAPTNGSTAEAGLVIKRAGVTQGVLANYFSGSFFGLWFGAGIAPTVSNFAFIGDGASTTYVNAPLGGTVSISTNGTGQNGINVTATTCYFNAANPSACTYGQAPQTTDAVAPTLTVSASNAWTSAVTNLTGGTLNLKSGTNKDGTTFSSIALSPTALTFRASGTTLGTMAVLGTGWGITLDASGDRLAFNASGASQFIQFAAGGAGGRMYFDTATINFRDIGGIQTIAWSLASSGTTTIAFASTVTSAQITAAVGITLGSTTGINAFLGGETRTTITVTNTNRTLDTTTKDCVIFVKTSTTPVSLTLPAPTSGRRFRVIDINGTLSTNALTLVRNAAEKINGVAASKVLTTDWGQWEIYSDGTDWYVG